jgi:hypothetical protein
MRGTRFIVAGVLAAAAHVVAPLDGHAASATCAGVDGVDQLLAPGIVVLVGEVHGTAQSPAFVSALACNAIGAGFPVTVALEIPVDEAGRVDAFLASGGAEADRAALIAGPFWAPSAADGRSSIAMVDLIDDLRVARAAAMSIAVALLDSSVSDRDAAMAARVADAAAADPDGIVIALTGNVHTRVQPDPAADPAVVPMGQLVTGLLGADRVVALDVTHAGGSAWVCTDACGETTLQGGGPPDSAFRLSLHLDDASSGFHGEYSVGPLTASPPAAT